MKNVFNFYFLIFATVSLIPQRVIAGGDASGEESQAARQAEEAKASHDAQEKQQQSQAQQQEQAGQEQSSLRQQATADRAAQYAADAATLERISDQFDLLQKKDGFWILPQYQFLLNDPRIAALMSPDQINRISKALGDAYTWRMLGYQLEHLSDRQQQAIFNTWIKSITDVMAVKNRNPDMFSALTNLLSSVMNRTQTITDDNKKSIVQTLSKIDAVNINNATTPRIEQIVRKLDPLNALTTIGNIFANIAKLDQPDDEFQLISALSSVMSDISNDQLATVANSDDGAKTIKQILESIKTMQPKSPLVNAQAAMSKLVIQPSIFKEYLHKGSSFEFGLILGNISILNAQNAKYFIDELNNRWNVIQQDFRTNADKQETLNNWIQNSTYSMSNYGKPPLDVSMVLLSSLLSKTKDITNETKTSIARTFSRVNASTIQAMDNPAIIGQIVGRLDPLNAASAIGNVLANISTASPNDITPKVTNTIIQLTSPKLFTEDTIDALLNAKTGNATQLLNQIKTSLQNIGSQNQVAGIPAYNNVIKQTINLIQRKQYPILTWLKDIVSSIPAGLQKAYQFFIQKFNAIRNNNNIPAADAQALIAALPAAPPAADQKKEI